MASSSTELWPVSLNMDELQAECRAGSEDASVVRIPPYIRDLKPHIYNPLILPMGMFNRDFTKKTPMDQLKFQVVSAFLGHLNIDHNGWKSFCREVADARGEVFGPGARDLERFYEDDGRPSLLTPELELSVLIIDAFFIVALLIRVMRDELYLGPPVLLEQILNIFDRRAVACHYYNFVQDTFWLYENQVPLFLVENVWAKVVETSKGFDEVLTSCLFEVADDVGFPCKVDIDVAYSKCEHLLACLHKGTESHALTDNDPGTRPLLDDDTVIGRFKSYTRKVPGVMQFLNFTKQMASTVGRVKARYRTRNGSSPFMRTLPSATYLRKAGIHIRGVETTMGDIRFVKSRFQLTATLYLPSMDITDSTDKMLLNLCAYENMNGLVHKKVTNFVCFLDELIDSEEDVDLLMRGNEPVIKVNSLGDNKKVADAFAYILQNYDFLVDEQFSSITDELIAWYNVQWRRQLIGFLHRFAVAPWLLVSLIAATILLVLTLLQTIYTMWGFYNQY